MIFKTKFKNYGRILACGSRASCCCITYQYTTASVVDSDDLLARQHSASDDFVTDAEIRLKLAALLVIAGKLRVNYFSFQMFCTALVLSALRQSELQPCLRVPFNLWRAAIFACAKPLPHLSPLEQGAGLFQVGATYEFLRDIIRCVLVSVQILTCLIDSVVFNDSLVNISSH